MSKHAELLDALEARLRSLEFSAMTRGAVAMSVDRPDPLRLTVSTGTAPRAWDLEVVPLPEGEGPDGRPRLLIRSATGGPTYADHAVDGLSMSVFAMLLAGRREEAGAG